MTDQVEVAVVGAGPYGLSVGATLAARGVRARVFGEPMHTWRTQMPRGMVLRSTWEETSLWCGGAPGTTAAWEAATGEPRRGAPTLAEFLRYADWFVERHVPDRDAHDVVSVEPDGRRFRVMTTAGDEVDAGALVVAPGVVPFAYAPDPLAAALGSGVRLAGEGYDYATSTGRRLLVVGAGQAGLEAAALAAGSGAEVELVARSRLRWFADREPHRPRGWAARHIYRLAYPAVGYGPPPLNRLVLHPDLFVALPPRLRRRLTRRLLRPGGSPWLRPLVEEHVRVTEGASLSGVDAAGDALRVRLSDGSERIVDEVIVATGYRFRLERLAFLADGIRRDVRVADDWPVLDGRFGTSVPGLSLVGFPAEGRFGPLCRFVLGARFTAERVAAAACERR